MLRGNIAFKWSSIHSSIKDPCPGENIGLKFISNESVPFRAISESVSELFLVIPDEYEKRFVSRLTKKGKKSIRINPNKFFNLN